jgi:hypothetical protein
MKKIILSTLVGSSAFFAVPAAAQTVGTVNVTGSVTGRCSVVQPAGTAAGSFSGTIALGALDDSDGTLKDSLEGAEAASAAGTPVQTRIVCNSANPTVAIAATSLRTGDGTKGGSGYSDDVHYTARVDVTTVTGTESRAIQTSNNQAPSGLSSSGALTQRVAAGAANNVRVSLYALAAENGATSLLNAGEYAGSITVTIQPGT